MKRLLYAYCLTLLLLGSVVVPKGVAAGPLWEDRTESTDMLETTYNGYDSREPIYTIGPVTGGSVCYLLVGQYEISNMDTKHNIMVAQTIIRHADINDTRGIRVLPASGKNVDRQRYHEDWNGSVVDCPPSGEWYYSLNVYSGLRKKIKPAIRVEQGYGFLQAWRLWDWNTEMKTNPVYTTLP